MEGLGTVTLIDRGQRFDPVAASVPAARRYVAARLEAAGFAVDRSERDTFPGYVRFHTFDGHGNRVEIVSP